MINSTTVPRQIAIFGQHYAALEVAGHLRFREYHIVIVDDDEDHLARARNRGFKTARLDFRDDAELKNLGLGKEIHTVFSLFAEDAENVYLTISIRALAPGVRVLTVAHDTDSVPKLVAAGADKVIDVHEISGRHIWNLLQRPQITEMLESTLFGETGLNLEELTVRHGCFLDGQRMDAVTLDADYGLILIGAVDADRGEQFVITSEGFNHHLHGGDTLMVIGHNDDIQCLREDIANQPPPVSEA